LSESVKLEQNKNESLFLKKNSIEGLDEKLSDQQSPKYSPKFREITRSALQTMKNSGIKGVNFYLSNQNISDIEVKDKIFSKEKLSDLKKEKPSLLFTIKDPGGEEMVK
jgi:hypothetical protein